MAYTPVPTKADGDPPYNASFLNTYIFDNWRAGLPDKFTAAGQLCYATAANTAGVLAAGTVGYFLKSSGSAVAWGVHPYKDPITAKGGLIFGTQADTVAQLAIGPDSSYLIADSTQTTGARWANNAAARGKTDTSSYVADGWYPISFDAEDFDVASALSSTEGFTQFTVPVTGYYFASAYLAIASSLLAVNRYIKIAVYDGATQLSILGEHYAHAAATFARAAGGYDILYLTAAHNITIQVYSEINAATATDAHVSFIKLGV